MGHKLALNFLLVGIKVLNQPKINKYILYFKTVSLKKTCVKCVPCCLATVKYRLNNQSIFHYCLVAKQQTTSLSNKVLDMLLHAQQVMPPNDYICDVLLVGTLVL